MMNSKKNIAVIFLLVSCAITLSAQTQKPTLVGWGMDKKNLDTFFREAADVGFDALITWSTDPEFLTRAVATGKKYNIEIYSSIAPMSRIAAMWEKTYPHRPVPWQVMTDAENAACSFISAGKNKYLIPYQWGGEPVLTNEVLTTKIICFSSVEGRRLLESLIDGILTVPGIAGIAFDGFGYQNYHGCDCPTCQKELLEYRRTHPDQSKDISRTVFFRDKLVDYINHLAAYARSKNAKIKTTIHIWPVFAPEPLYGNRLDVDYCGQTAAWYTCWTEEKIARYSRVITRDATKYHRRQQGVGMIGYYDRPGKFPVKTAARVDMELKTMIENGCDRIQVCGTRDVIRNKKIAAVFRKYFR